MLLIYGFFMAPYWLHQDVEKERDDLQENLTRASRIEVLTPVEDLSLQQELSAVFDVQLNDHRKTWDMQGDGTYVKRTTDGDQEDCQGLLIGAATRRQFEATRLRRRKPRGVARRISAQFWGIDSADGLIVGLSGRSGMKKGPLNRK